MITLQIRTTLVMGIFFFFWLIFENIFGIGKASKNIYILNLNETWNAVRKFRTVQSRKFLVCKFS